MVLKRKGVLIGFLFLIILSLGVVSAESCAIVNNQNCDATYPYKVMGLSSYTNAHGELWDQNNYNYALCCDFQRSKVCDGTGKFLGLSASTNAHAETPEENNYGVGVCYANITCRTTTSTSCGENEMGLFSLSDITNAHIGEINDYRRNICCEVICGLGEANLGGNCVKIPVLYWADTNQQYIEIIPAEAGKTTILMILENSGLSEGTDVDFEIYENDGILLSGYIKTITASVDSDGTAIASWTITQADLDIAFESLLEGDELVLSVGFTHQVRIKRAEGIKILAEKNIITISGIDKELVGQTASSIRKVKPPDSYKGKGIRYLGEVVRKKAGKKVVTAGT